MEDFDPGQSKMHVLQLAYSNRGTLESLEQKEIEQPLEFERILVCFCLDAGGRLMCRAE